MTRFNLNLLDNAPSLLSSSEPYRDNKSQFDDETDGDDDASSGDLTYSSDESNASNKSSEPDHPLGFGQRRTSTRYGLVTEESLQQYKRRWGYFPIDESILNESFSDYYPESTEQAKSKPTPSSPAPQTQVLIQYAKRQLAPPKQAKPKQQKHDDDDDDDDESDYNNRCSTELDEDVDMLAQLLQAADILDVSQELLQLQSSQQKYQAAMARLDRKGDEVVSREISVKKQQYAKDHQEAALALTKLLASTQEAADKIVAVHRQKQKQQDEKDAADAAAAQAAADKIAKEKQQKAEKQAAAAAAQQAEKDAADAVEKAKTAYVDRAHKLVAQLKKVRASVEPFEESKAVAKRRLLFKKTVNGKVNTLAENVDKIRGVASDVSATIGAARAEDEQVKQKLKENDPIVTPEMALGKRYMIDLLCSKVIVRAQAEGFNGQRGDGFPLANCLALVSVENKELIPILAAHIYTVCPTAIPTLPHATADASEEEFMKSLGMLQLKDGNFETFERFLARTEGVISLVANIMASEPPTHVLMDGHYGAVKWLTRFLSLLPEAPQSPLPLVTAPVLDAFLTGAGHMLANHHPDEFKPLLDSIMNDVVHRLDEGAVGMPSMIRLKKTINGGMESFKTKLPSRALSELYLGADKTIPIVGGRKTSSIGITTITGDSSSDATAGFAPAAAPSPSMASPFGNSNQNNMADDNNMNTNPVASQPFGSAFGGSQAMGNAGAGKKDNRLPCRFFAQGKCNKGDRCKFSHESPSTSSGRNDNYSMGESAFGNNNNTASSVPSSFGGFGAAASPSPFVSNAQTPSPFFGGAPASNPSPFGGATAVNPSPFGGGASAVNASPFGTSNTSPFGGGAAAGPSPFGGGGASAPNPSPFGGGVSSASSPFGGGAPPPSSSPFGATAPSPFGNTSAPSPSPFGNQAPASNPSPFGAPTPSPFGDVPTMNSSPFGGGSNPAPFGNPAPSPSPFGGGAAPSPSPFGNAAPSPSPFRSDSGPASNSSPFGNPSPFGGGSSTQNQSPFGTFGGQQQQNNSPFGGFSQQQQGGQKQPCKFFAQGRCRYGDNCKFSHDTPQQQNSFASSNPFGGPRR